MTIITEVLAGLIALLTALTNGALAEPAEPTTVVAEAASVPTAEAVSSRYTETIVNPSDGEWEALTGEPPLLPLDSPDMLGRTITVTGETPEQVLEPITRQEAIDQGGGAIDTALEPEQVLTCTAPAYTRTEQLIVADNGDGLALPSDVELLGIVGPGADEGTVVVDVVRNVAEATSTHTAASLDLSGGIPEGCTLELYQS